MGRRTVFCGTRMYWLGPFTDITGRPVDIISAWRYRVNRSARRLWTVRMRKHWIANFFFSLWVSTDVIALVKGTAPLIPLSVWGACFGVALVAFEWWILVEEFRESAPLHVIWQPRVQPAPHPPYMCVHFESKNRLPFEVRCTFTNDRGGAITLHPSEYQEFVPDQRKRTFTYQTAITRSSLNALAGFKLYVDIAPLLAHSKIHDHWVYHFALDTASGKFRRTGGMIGSGQLCTQTWWCPEEQDEQWLNWESGV